MENQSGGLEGRVSEAETIRLLANLDAIGQILNRFHRDIVAYTKRKGLETDCYEAVKMYDSLPDNHPIRRQFKPENVMRGYNYVCSKEGWIPYIPKMPE